MNIQIRQEIQKDFPEVFALIREAFAAENQPDQAEQFLVERLRKSAAFVPELSLVAEADGKILGHILLTRLKVKNEKETFESLALAPVSVLPAFQNQGIGSKLISEAHEVARNLGFQSVILIGHADYYPRFGYQPAHLFGIRFPFEAPPENCFVLELVPGSLEQVSGLVEYPSEFFQS